MVEQEEMVELEPLTLEVEVEAQQPKVEVELVVLEQELVEQMLDQVLDLPEQTVEAELTV